MASNAPEERQRFIGGTDIAGILGLSRWKTPLSVWAEKTGQFVAKDEPSLQKTLGNRLEEVVAELFTEKTGLKVQRANERRIHPKYPMFAAQIDRLVVGTDDLLECKTASAWKAKEWAEDEIPAEYICQVMWQLACSGRKRGHIAALIGNEDFRVKIIERDQAMIDEMVRRAKSFWDDFIVPKIMPMQITASDKETLYGLFPTAEKESQIELGDAGAKLIESRNALIQDKAALIKQIDGIENMLKAMLKEKESGTAGSWRISWKNVERKGYTVEATQFRQFNVRQTKET